METTIPTLTYSDIAQGIVYKELHSNGKTSYVENKNGNCFWFDTSGHLIHKKTPTCEELREYYPNGTIKSFTKLGQYRIFYNEDGLKICKIKDVGSSEYWEYDKANHLKRWYNSDGFERLYNCDSNGKVVSWRCNHEMIAWYTDTGRKFDMMFAGVIE